MNMTKVIKAIAKFILRSSFRRMVFREIRIRKKQNKALKKHDQNATSLIVFLVGGADLQTGKEPISGGLLSIHSLYEETLALNNIHQATVILATIKDAYLFHEFSGFRSVHKVFRFTQLYRHFHNIDHILIHVPEYLVCDFAKLLNERKYVPMPQNLHVNILNQNIRLMPPPGIIADLKRKVSKLTQTTAHKKYATQYWRDVYDIPLHHFSTYVSPEKYEFTNFRNKKEIIVFSPDDDKKNHTVIEIIRNNLPCYQVIVINKMTYEEFKKVIGSAKFTFTFGEGMDAYFVESVFTGGVCFAIYNEEFFTPDFASLETVYRDYDHLLNGFIDKIKELENEQNYQQANKLQFDRITEHYGTARYQENIRKFYNDDYLYK